MSSRRMWIALSLVVWLVVFPSSSLSNDDKRNGNGRRPNLLYIVTDQQRYDAIGYVQRQMKRYHGSTTVRTPNMDRLLQSGVHVEQAYSHSPVCAAARGVLRTGCTLERNGVQSNRLEHRPVFSMMPVFETKVQSVRSLDQLLTHRYGYRTEYYGKWHLVEDFHYQHPMDADANANEHDLEPAIRYNDYDYANDEFHLRTHEAWSVKYRRYLRHDTSTGKIGSNATVYRDSEQEDTYSLHPYLPAQIDARYGFPTKTDIRDSETYPELTGRFTQPNVIGQFTGLGPEHTATYYNTDVALRAMKRLKAEEEAGELRPFALTVCYHSPHAPFVAQRKYLEYYWERRNDLWVSPSIGDDLRNSAYSSHYLKGMGYNETELVAEWIAIYYALIEEIDDGIGQILDKLDQYGWTQDTLVVFTSDHGEMLGAHGLREKNVFYEESVRVPLAMSFPGVIAEGSTFDDGPVGHLDLFATILDYLGCTSSHEPTMSDSTSLRSRIEGTSYNRDYDENVVVAEWDHRKPINATQMDRRLGDETNFMVVKGDYKLMMTKLSSSARLDMLYNLAEDPYETHNLLGRNGMHARKKDIAKAEHLKALLIEWMIRHNGPGYYGSDPTHTDSVVGPFQVTRPTHSSVSAPLDKMVKNSDGVATIGSGGDIVEIHRRRTWRLVHMWISETVLTIGRPARMGNGLYRRHEYLYFGRTAPGILFLRSVRVIGADAGLFRLGYTANMVSSPHYSRLKVVFLSDKLYPKTAYTNTTSGFGNGGVDARILIECHDRADVTIDLVLGWMDDEDTNYNDSATTNPDTEFDPFFAEYTGGFASETFGQNAFASIRSKETMIRSQGLDDGF